MKTTASSSREMNANSKNKKSLKPFRFNLDLAQHYPETKSVDQNSKQKDFRKQNHCSKKAPCGILQCSTCDYAFRLNVKSEVVRLHKRQPKRQLARFHIGLPNYVNASVTTSESVAKFIFKVQSLILAAGLGGDDYVGAAELWPRWLNIDYDSVADPDLWNIDVVVYASVKTISHFNRVFHSMRGLCAMTNSDLNILTAFIVTDKNFFAESAEDREEVYTTREASEVYFEADNILYQELVIEGPKSNQAMHVLGT